MRFDKIQCVLVYKNDFGVPFAAVLHEVVSYYEFRGDGRPWMIE